MVIEVVISIWLFEYLEEKQSNMKEQLLRWMFAITFLSPAGVCAGFSGTGDYNEEQGSGLRLVSSSSGRSSDHLGR